MPTCFLNVSFGRFRGGKMIRGSHSILLLGGTEGEKEKRREGEDDDKTQANKQVAHKCRQLKSAGDVQRLANCTGAIEVAQSPAPLDKNPTFVLIVSDDFGYGDSGVYGSGPNRGMPTPNLDRMADEGMTFFTFYAQPSCTPGRAAMQTGRIPNRSGMTTVALQGQGGGLPSDLC
jgi:hypothetical protein